MRKLLSILASLLVVSSALASVPYPGTIGQIGGIFTYATLPDPTTIPIGTYAFTSDQGYAYTNGLTWVVALTSTGNAATATALAAAPTQCPSGQAPLGIDVQGNALSCFTPSGSGTVSTTGSPAANQLAYFSAASTITGIANSGGYPCTPTQSSSGSAPVCTGSAAVLSTTVTLGGSSIAGGACTSSATTVTVSGAATTNAVFISAAGTDPGGVYIPRAWVSTANTVNYILCNIGSTGTPASTTYNVRIVP